MQTAQTNSSLTRHSKRFKSKRTIRDVEVILPKAPVYHELILNHHLPKKQQKFSEVQKDIISYLERDRLNKIDLDDWYKFKDREWERRRNGIHFYNNGNIEYLTGLHYFYLGYWKFPIVNEEGRKVLGLPRFVDSDRDRFYFWDACVKDDNCFGMDEITNRRDGKTYRGLATIYETISKTPESLGGIQSKTNTDAKTCFNRLVKSWQKLPGFFKPMDSGEKHPATSLRFQEPGTRDTKQQKKEYAQTLRSEVNYENAKEEAYDGEGLLIYLGDEIGKCLTINTPIRMYDGSLKMVQDIVTGDILMGDNSTPRNVLSTTAGESQCYDVIPNKGEPWGCNDEHILSLSVSTKKTILGKTKDDILNISVKEFLQLPKSYQKHLSLYRVAVEYNKREVLLDPYLLGVWLGDGDKDKPCITNSDPEIIQYMKSKALENGIDLNRSADKKCVKHNFSSKTRKKGSNFLLKELQGYNLLYNKHIPKDYLFNNRDTRLQILAGLLDTDGNLNIKEGKPTNYEITQKIKELALGIKELALGLGFYSSINNKIATMKRKDGTIYKCPVYRVFIYGDLYKIPCKVKRRIAWKFPYHKNRRNPSKTGFKLKSRGKDKYYGFTIDGNHLFCLGDYIVTHNTVDADVYERWLIVKECLADGSIITGKALLTTTVEEMERKGGKNCKKIWDRSDPLDRNEIGQTESGLYKYFKPAYYGYRGKDKLGNPFIDEYGYSKIEAARKFLEKKRKNLKGASLSSEKRKYPFEESECFIIDNQQSPFDTDIMYSQIEHNSDLPVNKVVQGNFIWVEKDKEARFVESREGKWKVVWMPREEDRNKILLRRGKLFPPNRELCCAGVDPFDHRKPTDSGKKSNAASLVRRKFDPMDEYNSKLWACLYVARPPTPELFYEDMIIQSFFYGCEILPETNKIGLNNYFRTRGYWYYLMKRPEPTHTAFSRKNQEEPGIPMTGESAREALIGALESEIYTNIGYNEEKGMWSKCYFSDLLLDMIEFEVDNWTPYDLTVAAGLSLLAERQYIHVKKEEEHKSEEEWVRRYRIKGTQSVLVKGRSGTSTGKSQIDKDFDF